MSIQIFFHDIAFSSHQILFHLSKQIFPTTIGNSHFQDIIS